MLKIINNEIEMTRGDKGVIPVQLPISKTELYQFQVGDVITFGLYKKDGYDEDALILKDVIITEPTDTALIPLTKEETRIGEITNKPVEYWYEITLNGDETILGYEQETGAKIFIMSPEGSGKNAG